MKFYETENPVEQNPITFAELVKSFPTLNREVSEPGKGNPEEWPKLLVEIAMDPFASMGQRQAAAFCLHVWNGREFSLSNAWAKWDGAHRSAFKAWAQNPRFF